MSAEIRIPLIISAVAFVLSLLIAMVARNAFGIALLKALIFALVFGGAAFGIMKLLQRFVPELFDSDLQPEDASGSRIDIVVDEPTDVMDIAENTGSEFPKEPKESSLTSTESLVEDAEPMTDDVLFSESIEDRKESYEIISAQVKSAAGEKLVGDSDAAPVEEISSPLRPSDHFEDLDVLPELDGFGETMPDEGTNDQFTEPTGDSGYSSGVSHSERSSQSHGDPESLAKAIHTILKREQKG